MIIEELVTLSATKKAALRRLVHDEQWRSTTLHNYDERVNLELTKADQVEGEAWVAWDNSIGRHTVATEKEGRGEIETITQIEELTGDPQFLQTILKCIDLRCRILGLFAPTNIKVSSSVQPTLELLAARRLKVETMQLLNESSCGQANN